jgi:WD40 repeat protein
VTPDGRRFATGEVRNQICLWDAATGADAAEVATYPDVDWGRTALTADGRAAVSVGTDGRVCFWNLADGRKQRIIERGRGRAFHLSFTPDRKALLVREEKRYRLLDVATGKQAPLPGTLPAEADWQAGPAPDGRTLATFHGGVFTLWDWPAGKPRWQFRQPGPERPFVSARLSPDGRRLATRSAGEPGEVVELWEVPSGRRLGRLVFPERRWRQPFFSPDGAKLVLIDSFAYGFSSPDSWVGGAFDLWDTARPAWRLDFAPPVMTDADRALQFGPVAFSPDGRTLAVGSGNRPIVLFEVASGQVRLHLSGHRGHVTSLEFMPDGRLVSTSSDRTGLVWDVRRASAAGPAGTHGWDDLVGEDARAAYRAMVRLAAAPEKAVTLLRERLKPVLQPDDAALERLVADLDDKAFAVRDRATAALDRLGHAVVPGVLARLGTAESLELRRRLEQFLDKHDRGVPPPEALRQLRAVELLEQLGSPAARAQLRDLAGGSPVVRLTQEAAAALRRLGRGNG